MMTMYEMAKKGISLKDILIIDEHCHMGTGIWNYIPDGSPQAIDGQSGNRYGLCIPQCSACSKGYIHKNCN